MTKKHAPASGEQNAIRGYLVQYEFSARTLLRLMQDNRFDAISVCDHAAGILDDLVVFSGHDLLAYQVKSQTFPKPFRLKTELVSNSLIAEIAKSWTALREEYPDKGSTSAAKLGVGAVHPQADCSFHAERRSVLRDVLPAEAL